MRAYLSVLRLRFLLLLQYRVAALAAISNYFFFGLVRIMVFDGFFQSSTASQPMGFSHTVTYQWLVQAMLFLQPWSGDPEVDEMIRSGNVAYELCRPADLYNFWFSRCMAYRLAPTIVRALPVALMAMLLVPAEYRLQLPATPGATGAWLISTAGALVVAAAFSVLYNIATLWTISGDGIARMLPMVVVMLSGSSIPIAFFPDWLQPLLRLLPFVGMVDTPFRFYLGLLPPGALAPWLAHQLGAGRGFDVVHRYVRSGSFDRMLLRPRSIVLQVLGQDFQMLRVGRLVQGIAVLLWAAANVRVVWSPASIALVLLAILGGAALFTGLFVLQATVSFWSVDSIQVANNVTYGGVEAIQFPLSIYHKWLREFFVFVASLATVNYFPALSILGRPDPLGYPPWLSWVSPFIGVGFLLLTLKVFSMGIWHYHSTGS